jgi:exopolyphosphatase / guanosine-5'-triphosphate,3'-diphosphate pyrophosphatase
MRIAIIDLGTNTFNILIADCEKQKLFIPVFGQKIAVKLGRSGINNNIIMPDAIERAMNALAIHHQSITKYHVDEVLAIGTSAIRSSGNGREFTNDIRKRFGFNVKIISGEMEAEYIYLGVKQSFDFHDEKVLILDIGGGSNEFIIADSSQIYWKHSFNLGIARLNARFHPSNPLTTGESDKLTAYLESTLQPLFEAYALYKPFTLVGASGTFDTFRAMLYNDEYDNSFNLQREACKELDLSSFHTLADGIIASTIEERQIMKGLESVRIEMVVLATYFTRFILHRLKITKFCQSDYSLKEGVVAEFMNKL